MLIIGPSGSGKSFLAQAFGQHACRSGFPVQYLRMPTLLTLFVQARAQGTYDRLLKRLGKIALLIVDDFGLTSLQRRKKQEPSSRGHRGTIWHRGHDHHVATPGGRLARNSGVSQLITGKSYMGEPGSGNSWRFGSRSTTDDYSTLDVRPGTE
jgi:hypothetical protein